MSLWADARGDWRPSGDRPLRIADFGAGNERLRELLSARLGQPFAYFPFDLHPQQETTIRLNVLEESPAEQFDLVFALGLLEYLPPGNTFLERLRLCCRFTVVSFTYVGSSYPGGLAEREGLGWQAHHDRDAFEQNFGGEGFTLVEFRPTQEDQAGLWLWESPGQASASGPRVTAH